MKKVLAFILLLLSAVSLYAVKVDEISQPIAGFIKSADFCILEISNYFDDNIIKDTKIGNTYYRGINLDTGDTNTSNDKYLIMPSETLVMGKRIGAFNLKASKHTYTLKITHDKLLKKNGTTDYDYQLGVRLSINGNIFENACSSTQTLTLDFSGYGNGVLLVEDAGIYFRLIDTVSEAGQYTSTVTFIVEANGST